MLRRTGVAFHGGSSLALNLVVWCAILVFNEDYMREEFPNLSPITILVGWINGASHRELRPFGVPYLDL